MINKEVKQAALTRLNRIEGQVKGLKKMVEEEQYCIDLINQITAIRRALEQVALIVMNRHIESCVAEACKTRGEKAKIDELIRTVDRFIR